MSVMYVHCSCGIFVTDGLKMFLISDHIVSWRKWRRFCVDIVTSTTARRSVNGAGQGLNGTKRWWVSNIILFPYHFISTKKSVLILLYTCHPATTICWCSCVRDTSNKIKKRKNAKAGKLFLKGWYNCVVLCRHVSIECGTFDTDSGYSESTLLTLAVQSGRADAESVLNDLIVLGKNESARM